MIHLPFQQVNHRSHQAKTHESNFQSDALGMSIYLQEGGCPGLTPNMPMFAVAINKYGSLDEISRNPGKMRAASLFADVLKNQNPESCKHVRAGFGPNGTTIPGLAQGY